MEQVTTRVLAEMDQKLERHAKQILNGIQEQIKDAIATEVIGLFEKKVDQVFDKISMLVSSKLELSHEEMVI